MKLFRRLATFAAIGLVITLAIALGLIASQRPGPMPGKGGLDFAHAIENRFDPPREDERFLRAEFATPDGTRHPYTLVAAQAPETDIRPTLVMLHGSGWHGQQFDRLAWSLRDVAEIRVPTLRGHGADPQRRGDVDYVGQFEDDLSHVIPETDRPVILLGHSSGGGLVARFASSSHGDLIAGAIVLAPFLGRNAPTTREDSGGWARPLVRRIIGLSMLNSLGITALDRLPVLLLDMPRAVLDGPLGHTATTAYSWRLLKAFNPNPDWQADIAALPRFVLVAGAEDKAFRAELYQPTMEALNDRGLYRIIPDAGHLAIVDHPDTEAAIRGFLNEF